MVVVRCLGFRKDGWSTSSDVLVICTGQEFVYYRSPRANVGDAGRIDHLSGYWSLLTGVFESKIDIAVILLRRPKVSQHCENRQMLIGDILFVERIQVMHELLSNHIKISFGKRCQWRRRLVFAYWGTLLLLRSEAQALWRPQRPPV